MTATATMMYTDDGCADGDMMPVMAVMVDCCDGCVDGDGSANGDGGNGSGDVSNGAMMLVQ